MDTKPSKTAQTYAFCSIQPNSRQKILAQKSLHAYLARISRFFQLLATEAVSDINENNSERCSWQGLARLKINIDLLGIRVKSWFRTAKSQKNNRKNQEMPSKNVFAYSGSMLRRACSIFFSKISVSSLILSMVCKYRRKCAASPTRICMAGKKPLETASL